ncbi:coiled-coil domain-containing protein 172 isoform X1 [Tachyglossus aculeatus]|uniref:coiled-coil domain-containing protein 172 isoform X1 n=1 Tax=Tachyglossus aculeatus TaxID=9261 RepID=UPI0018F3C1E6|nr:coiled-coil domain-containing protein 172 isoform X1 [Tachyglossus aculeatus]XP_038614269.1 coiled-coil domain-containing protein 172 isoform X1 [Tachyglossus aculeatus]
MSLESLFQHIAFTEQQAEENRRLLHKVRSEIIECRDKIKETTEELNEAKIKLEYKAKQMSEKFFCFQLLKIHEDGLEKQCTEIADEKSKLLQVLEATKKKIKEEEQKFIKDITNFNNEYGLKNKRELLIKERIKAEISDLERQAFSLKNELNLIEQGNVQFKQLQNQKSELKEELLALQGKLKVIEDKVTEAMETTKYLEIEKDKISEKPQKDPECLRLKKELEFYREENMESICESLQAEIECLRMSLSQNILQARHNSMED